MPLLLKKAAERHGGKGINWGCNCSFCEAKKLGTYRIGNARVLIQQANRRGEYSTTVFSKCLDYRSDCIGDWIWRLRRAERKSLRQQLKELKE